MATLRPLGDKVIIEKEIESTTTKSGIVLPDSIKEKPNTGVVISVGPGKLFDNGTRNTMEVKIGDNVYYTKYCGTDIIVDDKELLILSESDIIAIVDDKKGE